MSQEMEADHEQTRGSRTGVLVSVGLHGVILGALFLLAASEGMLGTKLRRIAVTFVPPEAVPEQSPIPQVTKPTEPAPVPRAAAPPPSTTATEIAGNTDIPQEPVTALDTPLPLSRPFVAPPPVQVPELDFGGGQLVEASSDPKALYRSFVEYTLRSNWTRPENVPDLKYVVEVQIGVDETGLITHSDWVKGSGNRQWDASVRQAIAQTKTIGRKPPAEFPKKITVRFDVQRQPVEPFSP